MCCVKSPEFELNASFSPDARLRRLCVHRAGHPGGVHPAGGWRGRCSPGLSSREVLNRIGHPMGSSSSASGTSVLAVDVRTQPDLVVGTPRTLFEGPYVLSAIWDRNYDVTADGQRFLMVRQADAGDSTVRLNIVVNWLEELKEKAR